MACVCGERNEKKGREDKKEKEKSCARGTRSSPPADRYFEVDDLQIDHDLQRDHDLQIDHGIL